MLCLLPCNISENAATLENCCVNCLPMFHEVVCLSLLTQSNTLSVFVMSCFQDHALSRGLHILEPRMAVCTLAATCWAGMASCMETLWLVGCATGATMGEGCSIPLTIRSWSTHLCMQGWAVHLQTYDLPPPLSSSSFSSLGSKITAALPCHPRPSTHSAGVLCSVSTSGCLRPSMLLRLVPFLSLY